MVRRTIPGFFPLPRITDNYDFIIKVGGNDVTDDTIGPYFTKCVTEEIGSFELELENTGGEYNDVQLGATVEFLFDYREEDTDATTVRFKGRVEKISGGEETLTLSGSHISSELFDVLVTAKYTGSATSDQIVRELVDTFLAGRNFTYTNVNTTTITPVVTWNNKPFFDCMIDLCNQTVDEANNVLGFDFYVDDDKDFHFFQTETIENYDEYLQFETTMDVLSGLEEDQFEVKNDVVVQGEDDSGLPVLHNSSDSSSQNRYGVKQRFVKNSDIKTSEEAKSVADGVKNASREKILMGEAGSDEILIGLNPGDLIWVDHPLLGIQAQYKVYKYTFYPWDLRTDVVLGNQRSLPKIIKERIKKEQTTENIENPNVMKYSVNFPFNDLSAVPNSTNIGVKDSRLYRSGGVTGTAISSAIALEKTPANIEFRARGNTLNQILFYYSEDAVTWTLISLNTAVSVSFNNAQIYFKIEINDGTGEVDGLAILYK